MKHLLFLASVTVALTAAPAMADNGQVFDYGAQLRAYPAGERLDQKQCFNGKAIRGVNRAGGKILYVQSRQGSIYGLELAETCVALNAAQNISVRSSGGDVVCVRGSAEMVVQTPAGARRCSVAGVRTLTPREMSVLSTARR